MRENIFQTSRACTITRFRPRRAFPTPSQTSDIERAGNFAKETSRFLPAQPSARQVAAELFFVFLRLRSSAVCQQLRFLLGRNVVPQGGKKVAGPIFDVVV